MFVAPQGRFVDEALPWRIFRELAAGTDDERDGLMMRDTNILLKESQRLDQLILRLTLAIWTSYAAIVVVRAILWGARTDLATTLVRLGTTAIGLVLTLILWRFLRRRRSSDIFTEFRRASAASMVACLFHIAGNETLYLLFQASSQTATYFAIGDLVAGYFSYLWIFVTWSALYATLIASDTLRRQEREMADARDATQQARLAALRYQIQPHFLFNALNSISSLIGEGRTKEADEATLRLAGFYRHTLSFAPREFVPLRTELDAQRLYLSIEEVRFSDRLKFRFDVDPRSEHAMVPSLILQPFVENAIKHGLARSTGPTEIRVEAKAHDDRLTLSITDDSQADAPSPSNGIGRSLHNVRQRLDLIYDGDFKLSHGPRPAAGWGVTIDLPLELERTA